MTLPSTGLILSRISLQWLPDLLAEAELMAQRLSVHEQWVYLPVNALHSSQIVATQTMSCILMKERRDRSLSLFDRLGNWGSQRLNDRLKTTRQFIPECRVNNVQSWTDHLLAICFWVNYLHSWGAVSLSGEKGTVMSTFRVRVIRHTILSA